MHLLVEQAQDFFARRCSLRVQNSTASVGIFQSEYQLCSMMLSPCDQFVNALRRFFQQEFHRSQIANPIARRDRILQVQTDFIFIAQPGRIAFWIIRLEAGEFFLGKHKHTSGLGQCNCRTQASDARADHHEVSLGWKDLHKPGGIVSPPEAGRSSQRIRYDGNAMPQATIHVVPRPYQASIENGLLTRAGSVLSELLPQSSRIFVITVAPVRKRWGAKFIKSLKASGFAPQVIMMPDGESSKRLATVEAMAEKLAGMGADRKAVIIALGGGVVGDVAGLLASVYMRGVEFVQVPTTVLAQVDASIGGKTAVNLVAGKNLLGTFHHPRVVLIDPTVLKTLPDREVRAGLYEALECGVIGNVELFLRFEQNRARI